MSPASSFQETLQCPHHSPVYNQALGGLPLPAQAITGLYPCATGRLIYRRDIFKSKIRIITVSVTVLSQQNSPLMKADEAKRRMQPLAEETL